MPGSIPQVGDPKLGAAVKSGVSGWQNLYLEHIGSDRRIFSEEVDPKRSPTHHRGPSEVLPSKSSSPSYISIRGAFAVHRHSHGALCSTLWHDRSRFGADPAISALIFAGIDRGPDPAIES